MKNLLVSAVFVASLGTSAELPAQTLPAPVIVVVDLNKVTSECNACKTAMATLRSQANAIQAREKTLSQQLETEGRAIQTEIDALKGAEPSAALKTKATAFETKRQSAVSEVENGKANIQRNSTYVNQQIGQKLGPIYQQVMQRHGANIMLEVGSTLATSSTIDVSAEMLTALNAAMPTLSTTAPAQTQQTPQGR
jgi:Skp family chaperone for outer membrane proteins